VEGLKQASAGSLESNDLLVFVSPGSGIKIEIESSVKLQFEAHIREAILSVVHELGVHDIHIKVEDKGALDFAVRARVKSAILRARGEK